MKKNAAAKVASACLAATMGLFLLGGCSSQEAADEPAAETQQEEQAEELLVIGTEADDALTMVFENATGKDITGIATKQSGAADAAFGDNLLAEGSWAAGDRARVYCAPFEATGSTSDGGDVALKPSYDIQLTYVDGATSVLHGVTFEEADEVSVSLDAESGLAYLVFDQDGTQATTLEAEKAVKQQEDEAAAAAAAEAEAAAAAEAEAAAAAQAPADTGYTYDYSYDYGYSGGSTGGGYDYGYSGGSGSGSGGAGQTEDSCMGGDLVLR